MTDEVKELPEERAADRDAGVCEREERHDRVARPRVPEVLEPLVRRDRQHQAPLGGARQLRRRLLPERAEQVRRALEVEARRGIGVGQQAHREADDHRLDARLVDRHPHRRADRRVEDAATNLQRSQHEHHHEEHRRDREVAERDVVRVGDADHEQGDEVVHDHHCEHEHAQPVRAGAPDEREDAQRERRVGRHRRAPAGRPRPAGVEREVDQDRHRQPAEPGQQRQHRAASLAQVADVELAPCLEADHEEEEGHQAVVDPAVQVLADPVAPDADRELGGPEGLVRRPVDVGPQESGDRGAEEEERAADLGAEKRADGQREVARPDRPAGQRRRRCSRVSHSPTLTRPGRFSTGALP